MTKLHTLTGISPHFVTGVGAVLAVAIACVLALWVAHRALTRHYLRAFCGLVGFVVLIAGATAIHA